MNTVKTYVWEFWLSGYEDRKIQGYVHYERSEYVLVLAEAFSPRDKQSGTAWKNEATKKITGVIHWRVIKV